MEKNILILTTDFPPSTTIGTQRILKICKYLSDKWKIHILTLKERYYLNETKANKLNILELNTNLKVWRTNKVDLYSLLIRMKNKIVKNNLDISGILCKTDNIPKFSKKMSLRKAIMNKVGSIAEILEFPDKDISWLPFSIINGIKIVRKFNISIIFTSAPRHSNLITAMVIKAFTKKKLFVDFRDPWARTPWLDEVRNSSAVERFKYEIIKKLEKIVVEYADQIFFTTQALKDEFHSHYFYLPNDKFKVFYNGYDPDHLHAKSVRRDRYYIGSSEVSKLIFSHIGSLYKKRDPKKLILAIKHLIKINKIDRKRILFRFIGSIGKDLGYLKTITQQLKIEDVIQFIPPVSYSDSFKYMQSSDVLIILQPDTKLMLPAKIFDYICHDKTILALGEQGGEVEKVVNGKFGFFADYNNVDEMQRRILQLIENPNRYENFISVNRKKYNIIKAIGEFEKNLESALI